MPFRTFDFCALQFLNQWFEKESGYCSQLLSSQSEEVNLAGLAAAAAYFRIARNLPRAFEQNQGLSRYKPVLKAIYSLDFVSPEGAVDTVDAIQKHISEEYGGRNVLSLTTKLLWLRFKSPIRIYDSQARTALGTPEGEYLPFYRAFSQAYTQHRAEIESACSRLSSVVTYSVRPDIEPTELNELVTSLWFKERVLDIYLWHKGNEMLGKHG